MATTKSLGTINIFPSTDSFAANKSSVGATDLNFIKQTAAEMSVVGGGIIAQSLGENGYVKFANGLILQWGSCNTSVTRVNQSFIYPIALNDIPLIALSTAYESNRTETWLWHALQDVTKTGLTVHAFTYENGYTVTAVGYFVVGFVG